ncbi:MAG: putative monovalent cation/H+ antiporter subunit A [Pseudomonadota bacterium]
MGAASGHDAKSGPGLLAYLPALGAAALFLALIPAVTPVASGEVLRWGVDWVPSLGVRFSAVLDGLSLTFGLLITGIGALVMLFAAKYLAGHIHAHRFGLYLFSFMLAMLGLVVSDNLLSLFVFWELTSITSYLLIGFGHADAKSRRSALQALLVTGMGGLALLAGFILIYTVVGSFDLEVVLASGALLKESPLYIPILVLVLAGAFTKSAQFPLHFWLPNAMAAPTPVSAYLHSATMVKAGVFLLARLHPALAGTDAWLWTLTLFGGVTAVFASVMALKQTDLKQALAYTTLMALGTLVLFLADGSSSYAITGFMAFLVTHSLYKAALFLVVGTVDHGTGSRDARVLGGLAKAMPVTAIAAALAGLSMAGLPPFVGFISKEVLYKGAAELPLETIVTAFALAANALMFAVAGIVAFKPFWGKPRGETPVSPHEGPWQMLLGPVILATLGLAFGLLPWIKQSILVSPGVDAVLGRPGEAEALRLWAGVNLALILSLITFALGFALYIAHTRLREALILWGDAAPSFDAGWDRFLDGLKALAAWQTRLLQSGRLVNYMAATFATLLVTLVLALALRGPALGIDFDTLGQLMVKEWAIAALILAGVLVVTVTDSRITAIAGLGVVGAGVALLFITYGAPDVAITQLLVEVLVVVLVALALLRLPHLKPEPEPRRKLDAVLALAIGGVVTLITLMVVSTPVDRRLSTWFEVTAWPEAYGRNIVNVILVDFRALDTFGEIAVVAIAALAALSLLRARRTGAQKEEAGQ